MARGQCRAVCNLGRTIVLFLSLTTGKTPKQYPDLLPNCKVDVTQHGKRDAAHVLASACAVDGFLLQFLLASSCPLLRLFVNTPAQYMHMTGVDTCVYKLDKKEVQVRYPHRKMKSSLTL